MQNNIRFFVFSFVIFGVFNQSAAVAQNQPDTLTFTNGERLVGHLVRASGSSVTFHSNTLGDFTVDWSKIQELNSPGTFVIIPKNVPINPQITSANLPRGPIAVANQRIQVGAQAVNVGDAAYVIDEATFQTASEDHNNPLRDWTGAITGGASLVEATQTSTNFTGAVALVRITPTEGWLPPRDRTTLNFAASYGKVDQPGLPTVKTNLYHLDLERDQYFKDGIYVFGQADYDHNFSQGLDLQQRYGGGIGWSIIHTPIEKLDVKGSMSYISQQFQVPSQNQNLVGSTFAQAFQRQLARGMVFTEQLSVTPAWNNTSAYSGTGAAALSMPVYKRFSLTLSTLDTFLNDPPPGFKKNSFQFTTGITYALK